VFPSDNMRGSLPSPGDQQDGPGAGGGFPAEPAQRPNPKAELTANLVAQIVSAARRIGTMYPTALEEMRTITNAMGRAQQKIVASEPTPETSAPPI
jgi:hypothetical protein